MKRRIRAWLHWRGIHALCRVRRVWKESPLKELIRTLDGDVLDITNQSGGIYRTVHF